MAVLCPEVVQPRHEGGILEQEVVPEEVAREPAFGRVQRVDLVPAEGEVEIPHGPHADGPVLYPREVDAGVEGGVVVAREFLNPEVLDVVVDGEPFFQADGVASLSVNEVAFEVVDLLGERGDDGIAGVLGRVDVDGHLEAGGDERVVVFVIEVELGQVRVALLGDVDAVLVDLDGFGELVHAVVGLVDVELHEGVTRGVVEAECGGELEHQEVLEHALVGVVGDEGPVPVGGHVEDGLLLGELDLVAFFGHVPGGIAAPSDGEGGDVAFGGGGAPDLRACGDFGFAVGDGSVIRCLDDEAREACVGVVCVVEGDVVEFGVLVGGCGLAVAAGDEERRQEEGERGERTR